MPTATPFTEPVSLRLNDLSDPVRQTDERGRPLSIFAARRQRGNIENREGRRRADELEAAVRSWSAARS
jgi:hypothetical protein